MEKLTLEQAVNEISQAFAQLEVAKAMMKGEKDAVTEETDNMNVLLQTIS